MVGRGSQIVVKALNLLLLLGVLLMPDAALTEQTPAAHAANVPRLSSGRPDMQGIWFFGSRTPYERPAELGRKRFYNADEARKVQQAARIEAAALANKGDPERGAPPKGAVIDNSAETPYESARIHLARINGEYRTSLIIEPENGQLPYRADALDIFDRWRAAGGGEFDGPEVRPPSERCVNGVGQMPPMIGWKYNANMRIVQTPEHFVIAGEMHSPRIIPVNTKSVRPGLRSWIGESLGRWEDDTLIVETKNFRAASSFFKLKSSASLQVTEWFNLISPNEILYRYTVTDPEIYTQPFTVEMSITRRQPGEHIYEWACHENNYSMRGILAGARRLESEEQ
jgi:hypothetical protein